ncbi:hypothetical protein Pint_35761 [Pistacia integerrima]|uniref:Uncharacterized protein n=1 Tax=Pistacia integerrima TaxID=434235 RepID=A0ACC0Y313_9ROSI|nr:hypothetical protein Pint_35761 [Pistacia integerrima]
MVGITNIHLVCKT